MLQRAGGVFTVAFVLDEDVPTWSIPCLPSSSSKRWITLNHRNPHHQRSRPTNLEVRENDVGFESANSTNLVSSCSYDTCLPMPWFELSRYCFDLVRPSWSVGRDYHWAHFCLEWSVDVVCPWDSVLTRIDWPSIGANVDRWPMEDRWIDLWSLNRIARNYVERRRPCHATIADADAVSIVSPFQEALVRLKTNARKDISQPRSRQC